MKSNLSIVVIITLLLSNSAFSQILWSYDLTELPYRWTHNGFQFGSFAHTYVIDEDFGPLDDAASYLQTDYSMKTSDWDSLVIDVSQDVEIHVGGSYSSGRVQLFGVINGGTTLLWSRACNYGTLTDSSPIHVSLTGFEPGDEVCFLFVAHAHAGMYGLVQIWWSLWDATLTAYGEASLHNGTWAGIKHMF